MRRSSLFGSSIYSVQAVASLDVFWWVLYIQGYFSTLVRPRESRHLAWVAAQSEVRSMHAVAVLAVKTGIPLWLRMINPCNCFSCNYFELHKARSLIANCVRAEEDRGGEE